jgi:putative spermidine/putrescine transport system ATP-binding protein
MGNRAEFAPAALSGGQQQRVALARALVFQPRGLLLDEPLSALDAGLRLELRDEILRVQRAAGIATLLVTHDQEEALSIADRVGIVRDGHLVQIATPRQLYDAPADPDVALFVGQSNLWPGTVAGRDRVLTAIGPIACDTGGRPEGEAVTILVRPEDIAVLRQASTDCPNVFSGRIVADRFLGSARRIDLAVEGGAVRLETSVRDAVEVVSIPPDAVRLLPAIDPPHTTARSDS